MDAIDDLITEITEKEIALGVSSHGYKPTIYKSTVDRAVTDLAALRALNVEAVEMLAPLQWCRWDDGRRMGRCPSCGNFSWDGHDPDCKLDALLHTSTTEQPSPEDAK